MTRVEWHDGIRTYRAKVPTALVDEVCANIAGCGWRVTRLVHR